MHQAESQNNYGLRTMDCGYDNSHRTVTGDKVLLLFFFWHGNASAEYQIRNTRL